MMLASIYLFFVIQFTRSAAVRLAAPVVIPASVKPKSSRLDNGVKHLVHSFKRISHGVTSFIPQGMEARKIRERFKKGGPTEVSFLDWKKIEQFSEDVAKAFRVAIFIPLSPELFFYSYLVSPILAGSNPFAWNSLPSGFDTVADKARRAAICTQRRFLSVGNALQAIRRDIIEDFNEETRAANLNNLSLAQQAMEASTHQKALDIIAPWIHTEVKLKTSQSRLNAQGLRGATVKDICRCIGVEGAPNIPLIRRANIGELNKYCDKVITLHSLDFYIL